MATYGANIPSLRALANADALAIAPAGAPPVVTGAALDVADIARAEDEYRARKKLKRANEGTPFVTVAEVASAVIRHHAIVSEHAVREYPGAGAPAWFAPALAAALAAALQPLQDAVQRTQDVLQHAESRTISRQINGQLLQDGIPIEPLVDNTGGIPNGFPATTRDVKHLPLADVDALLAAYGQTPRGTLDARRRQLGVWLGLRQRFP